MQIIPTHISYSFFKVLSSLETQPSPTVSGDALEALFSTATIDGANRLLDKFLGNGPYTQEMLRQRIIATDMDHTLVIYGTELNSEIESGINRFIDRGGQFVVVTSDNFASVRKNLMTPLKANSRYFVMPCAANALISVSGDKCETLRQYPSITETDRLGFIQQTKDILGRIVSGFSFPDRLKDRVEFNTDFEVNYQGQSVQFSLEIGPDNMALNLQGDSIRSSDAQAFISAFYEAILSKKDMLDASLVLKHGHSYVEFLCGTKERAYSLMKDVSELANASHILVGGDSLNDTELFKPDPALVSEKQPPIFGYFTGSLENFNQINPDRSSDIIHLPLKTGAPSFTLGSAVLFRLLQNRLES